MLESETFDRVRELVMQGEAKISEHGLQELQADAITVREIVSGVADGIVVEDYPNFGKGPCVLVLQTAKDGRAVHALWGLHKGTERPAVLITAYVPDPAKWDEKFMRRV